MSFNSFLNEVFDLLNKTNNIKITLTPQKGGVIDILVSVQDDVIVDTSMVYGFQEDTKMVKIINAIKEYC